MATIQLAIDEVLEQEQHQDHDGVQPEAGPQILAYVDDLTVLAPPVRLPQVLERLETALANVGLGYHSSWPIHRPRIAGIGF